MTTSLLAIALYASVGPVGKIEWVKDYNSAVVIAKHAKKLVMIDFEADWCTWCKRLDSDTFSNEKVIRLSRQVVSLKADVERQGKSLAKKYGVEGLPRILFLNSTGDVWGSISGYLPPSVFAMQMSRIVDGYGCYPELAILLTSNPRNGEANARMSSINAQRNRLNLSEANLALAEKANYSGRYLASGYNALGEAYQAEKKLDLAIAKFIKGKATSVTVEEKAYALVSLAFCYQITKDNVKAKRACNELINLSGAMPEFVTMARDILTKSGK